MKQTTKMKRTIDKDNNVKAILVLDELYELLKSWRSWFQWSLKLLLAVGVAGFIYICLWLVSIDIALHVALLLGFATFVYKALRHDYLLVTAKDDYVQYDWGEITSRWKQQKQVHEDVEEGVESSEQKLMRLNSIAKLSNMLEKQAYVKRYINSGKLHYRTPRRIRLGSFFVQLSISLAIYITLFIYVNTTEP